MLRVLINRLFHRPAYRFGKVDNARIHRTTLRNAQFVSFMSGQGVGRVRHSDGHDSRLRRQKFFRTVVVCSMALAFAWIALESAKALSMF